MRNRITSGLPAVALSLLLLSGCATLELDQGASQRCVDQLAALLQPHESLFALWENGTWRPKEQTNLNEVAHAAFRADALLSPFPHLSLRPGTVLDYVYHKDTMGAWPVLYTRPAHAAPFASYAELTNAIPGALPREELTNPWSSQRLGFYLDDLRADGSKASFFELVTLYVMGDQFWHLWHDAYHDETIICDPAGLESAVRRIPDSVRRAVRGLPLAPDVIIRSETVTVSIVIFTNWGGLQRRTYTLQRLPPHKILREDQRELVSYHCNTVM